MSSSAVVVVDPEPMAPPRITPATVRDCQVMDDRSQAVRWVRCLVSMESGLAYAFVRSLRDCIFGVVRHGVTLEPRDGFYRYRLDRQVAIKCMSKAAIQQQRGLIREDPMQELSALQLLSSPGHDHVQRLLETVQDQDHVYSICPFYPGGELFSFVEARGGGGLPVDRARLYFTQIASGLEYMQRHRLSNRDLSLENILLGAGEECVVIDMGMAIRVPPAPPQQQQQQVLIRSQGQCGKLTYMAPEVFADQHFDGYAVDVWALGVILFILLTGVPPVELPCREADPRFRLIADNRLLDLLKVWKLDEVIPEAAQDLLVGLLQAQPSHRLTLAQVMQHPWVTATQATAT